MAPQAELYDYRVFGKDGELSGDEAVAAAIRQAVKDGCKVINMSLRVSFPIVPAVRSAVEFAYSNKVIMVCAAGNSGDGDPTTNELYRCVVVLGYLTSIPRATVCCDSLVLFEYFVPPFCSCGCQFPGSLVRDNQCGGSKEGRRVASCRLFRKQPTG